MAIQDRDLTNHAYRQFLSESLCPQARWRIVLRWLPHIGAGILLLIVWLHPSYSDMRYAVTGFFTCLLVASLWWLMHPVRPAIWYAYQIELHRRQRGRLTLQEADCVLGMREPALGQEVMLND